MSNTTHRLFNQLMASNPSDEAIEELYQDLQYVFENPFDPIIEEAITVRKSTYIEIPDQLMN